VIRSLGPIREMESSDTAEVTFVVCGDAALANHGGRGDQNISVANQFSAFVQVGIDVCSTQNDIAVCRYNVGRQLRRAISIQAVK
jgi:hypothetical protein